MLNPDACHFVVMRIVVLNQTQGVLVEEEDSAGLSSNRNCTVTDSDSRNQVRLVIVF